MSTLKIRLGRVKGSIWYTGTADSNTAIATALTSAGYTPIKLDMYMNTSNGNVYQYLPLDDGLQWVLQGNLRGAKGEGFEIKKTYSSVAEMNKSYDIDDVPLYGVVLINTGNVEDEENARLYVKGDATYQFLTDLSGAQGIRGERGKTGDIGPEGLQGRGYYRANVKIDVSATTTSRANINPTNCRLLISDTIVDNVGNYFAVTANCEIGDATIKIAHRGYIGGKDGVDGLGVPSGGSTGQVLTKLSDADNDTAWKDPSGGGNTASEVLSVRTQLKTLPTTWEAKTWNGLTEFYGSLVWTDGENIYYSYLTEQYVLNRATSTWEPKTWNGLDNFEGQFVWTDGENIYYSKDTSNQYVLNRATSTWEPKTWNGNTPKGSFVWTDGENIYHNQYVLNKSTSTWEAKTWNGLQRPEGIYVWTDGENIYYSKDNSNQYVLDKATDTWQSKAWKTLDGSEIFSIFPKANKIWSDGENVYHSYSHVLNKETGNWEYKSWSLSSFDSAQIWTDGKNTYYNNSGSNQSYVLLPAIKGTSPSYKLKIREGYYSKPESGIPESDLSEEVQAKLNSGGGSGEGETQPKENILTSSEVPELVLTEGYFIYLSVIQYPLNLKEGNKYTLVWKLNGVEQRITSFAWGHDGTVLFGTMDTGAGGENIFVDPTEQIFGVLLIYDKATFDMSSGEAYDPNKSAILCFTDREIDLEIIGLYLEEELKKEYETNFKTTLTKLPNKWIEKTWNGLTDFNGNRIWTDGENIYYSQDSNQFVLNKTTSTWEPKTWEGNIPRYGDYVWTDGDNIYYSFGSSEQYILNADTLTWEVKTWNGYKNINGNGIWTDGNNIYYSTSSAQYELHLESGTWVEKTWNGLTDFEGINVWSDGKNIYYSTNNDQYILNRETSTWKPIFWGGIQKISDIWTDGDNIYSSFDYVLKSDRWESKKWTAPFSGINVYNIWTDGENIYYSQSSGQYVLVKPAIKTIKSRSIK